MTTAADYQSLATEAREDTLRTQGIAEQARMRGLTNDIHPTRTGTP